MGADLDAALESGLQYFGKMTASISHEIKNVLAIINENAGLLEDLSLMADKGRPLDPDRLKTLAGKIMSQIRRADGIILNMNTFAHSVDEPLKPIELGDILGLVMALSNRFASMRGVVLELAPFQDSIRITTRPFLLENMLWLCLDFAMDAAGRGKTVVVNAENTGNSAVIRFRMPGGLIGGSGHVFPGKREESLVGALKGKLTAEPEKGEIVLSLPLAITI